MASGGDRIADLDLDDLTVGPFESVDANVPAGAGLALVVMSTSFTATYKLPHAGAVTIGRARTAEIFVDDKSVSRAHAVITTGPTLTVRDLGSSNGTRVAGVRLPRDVDHPLRVGDAITVGSAVILLQPSNLVAATRVASRTQPIASTSGKRAVFVDPRMLELTEFITLIAAGDLGVLVLGETGAGKEVIAEELHRLSPRSHGPFVRINCGALAEALLESELFGYERGAFTNADKPKAGLLETASGGTVLLDEIGELPMTLQVKLLRVLEDKEVTRVGGLKPRPLDVRFLAATNRDLEAQVTRGLFREDLYYRVAGATVTIPPLRERAADIEPIARMFLGIASERLGKPTEIASDAVEVLRAHAWPGNVRELRNVIERAALVCKHRQIEVTDLPVSVRNIAKIPRGHVASTAPPTNSDPEATRILEALARFGGNQSRVAAELGLSRAALIRRIEKLGITRPRKPGSS